MLRICTAMLLTALFLAPVAARADDVLIVSKLNCRQFVELDRLGLDVFFAWFDGWLARDAGNDVFSLSDIDLMTEEVGALCLGKPNASAVDVARDFVKSER